MYVYGYNRTFSKPYSSPGDLALFSLKDQRASLLHRLLEELRREGYFPLQRVSIQFALHSGRKPGSGKGVLTYGA